MRKYSDYKLKKDNKPLTKEEYQNVQWTQFKIIVPNAQDKEELIEAFEKIHDEGYDSDIIVLNQLAHIYHESGQSRIIVNPKIYDQI